MEPEADKLDVLIKNLEGKKLHELIAAGSSKIVSVGGAAAGGAPAADNADAKPEEVKEEKVEETEQVDMGGLFDEDEDDY